MDKIDQSIRDCTSCHLSNNDEAFKPLPGRMVLGENLIAGGGKYLIAGLAPGVGRSNLPPLDRAMLLTDDKYPAYILGKLLSRVQWPVEETYITNIIKCALPENRSPTVEDTNSCYRLHFAQEICYMIPKVIICLGNDAYNAVDNRSTMFDIPIEKVYHHAYINRKPEIWEDWVRQWEMLKDYYV